MKKLKKKMRKRKTESCIAVLDGSGLEGKGIWKNQEAVGRNFLAQCAEEKERRRGEKKEEEKKQHRRMEERDIFLVTRARGKKRRRERPLLASFR